jgi:hypothetical protein
MTPGNLFEIETPIESTKPETTGPETAAPAPAAKQIDPWAVLGRVVIIVVGIGVGLVVATFLALVFGWIDVGC